MPPSFLPHSIKTLDHGQEDLAKELEQVRGKFRRCEREWLSEKETLHRKLQLCRQFGTSSSSSADVLGAGFFTDQRSALRLGGDARLHKRLQQVNVRSSLLCAVIRGVGIQFFFLNHVQSELADQKAAAESYRNQLLTMEAEMDTLREQNDAGKKALQVASYTQQPQRNERAQLYAQCQPAFFTEADQVDGRAHRDPPGEERGPGAEEEGRG